MGKCGHNVEDTFFAASVYKYQRQSCREFHFALVRLDKNINLVKKLKDFDSRRKSILNEPVRQFRAFHIHIIKMNLSVEFEEYSFYEATTVRR